MSKKIKILFTVAVFIVLFLLQNNFAIGEDVVGADGAVTLSGDGTLTDSPCASGTDSYCLLAPLPGITEINPATTNLADYLNIVIKFTIGFAGALAVIMIVLGGIQYMSTDAISGKSEGKDRITYALGGLLLALASYLILNTINPNLVNLHLGIQGTSITVQEQVDDHLIISDGTTATISGGVVNTTFKACKNENITIYDSQMQSAAAAYGLTCNSLKAHMYTESCGDPNAQSAYAKGLMQFTPATWTDYGMGGDIFNPTDSINASAKYLKALASTACNGSSTNSVCNASVEKYVSAAYNGGPGTNRPECSGTKTHWECVPITETYEYTLKIDFYKQLFISQGWGC